MDLHTLLEEPHAYYFDKSVTGNLSPARAARRMVSNHENPTQVSFGNFPDDVSARELADFLENRVGLVLRCKIKTSSTLPPHAFVHFVSPKVAKEAINKAEKGRLILRQKWTLLALMDERAWLTGRRGLNATVHVHIQLIDILVDIGSIVGPESMLVSWRGPKKGAFLRIEPASKRVRFFFSMYLELSEESKKIYCDVMLEIGLHEVRKVREVEREVNPVLLLQLSSPPSIYYRTAEDDIYEHDRDPSRLAEDEDPWTRCLDVVTPNRIIGRCLDYRLAVSPRQRTAFRKVLAFFKDHNVLQKSIQAAYSLSFEENFANLSEGQFFTVPDQKDIPFDVMMLLNSLVHRGIVHTSNLSTSFYNILKPSGEKSVEVLKCALRHMLTHRNPSFKPKEELESVIQWVLNDITFVKEPELREGNMVVRRLIITPTRAICLPPAVELSNRVLRHFRRLSDRFLRVSFLDEDRRSLVSGSLTVQVAQIVRSLSSTRMYPRTSLCNRVSTFMKEGFRLGGREYHFLAYSNGQLREGSAWFYATDGFITVHKIREWMGTFPDTNVAKFAARMGQCFSATFNTMPAQTPEVFELEDIERDGYDFSDGCGKISPEFAQLVAEVLKIDDNPPSAYQIRYAGYKGVVAVWPIEASAGQTYKLALRKSMKKFVSYHRQLEIVWWSRFLPCYLNRQIITLLSTLEVGDKVFLDLQEQMVENLNRMVVDRDLAYNFLRTSGAGDVYSTILRMLCAGFDPISEAYLKSTLVAIRAGQLEELVQKAKIFVPKGRWLLGCLDETGTLEYGECFVQVTSSGDRSTTEVVTGLGIMSKNPCLHPGDVRVLKAVDVPALHHMVDCLVFPQKGPRPHPNEASGSDLDGDVYFFSWDENLIPPSRMGYEPMEYETQVTRDLKHPVRIEDVVEFFVKSMTNDSLGKISNAHVVHADMSPKGALDESCLHLAELAAIAVDYPKTGKPAIMPFHLKPRKYPDFMEKEEIFTYKSTKIIGRLYRLAKGIFPKKKGALPLEESTSNYRIPEPVYDVDLEVRGFEAHLEKAWATKLAYEEGLRAIMTQFDVTTEGEVVTGHVMMREKMSNHNHGDVKERVACAYRALHKEYSTINPNNVEDLVDCGDSFGIVPDGVLQAQASAWYHVTYHPDWYRKAQAMNDNQRPFLSFPWLAVDHLIAIKSGKRSSRLEDRTVLDYKFLKTTVAPVSSSQFKIEEYTV